jgi:plasmid stabilization system protein ParE
MKIFWTKFALLSLSEIYKYYKENVNLHIANNICDSLLASARQLDKHSLSGQNEELLIDLSEDHRYLVRGNYKIIYKIKNKKIYITDVFDTRQDPEKVIRRNK